MTDTAEYEGYEPDTAATSRPVRVPNVSPNARSGLSGEVIGSNAVEAYDQNAALADAGEPITGVTAEGGTTEPLPPLDPSSYAPDALPIPPDGTLGEQVAWVREGETEEERSQRADAVFSAAKATDLDTVAEAHLAGDLRAAVYLDQPAPGDLPDVPEDATTVDALLAWVHETDDDVDRRKRAAAVLEDEGQRVDSDGEPDPRKTLVEPLEALLAAEPDQS